MRTVDEIYKDKDALALKVKIEEQSKRLNKVEEKIKKLKEDIKKL